MFVRPQINKLCKFILETLVIQLTYYNMPAWPIPTERSIKEDARK